jgi:hypothetical protein
MPIRRLLLISASHWFRNPAKPVAAMIMLRWVKGNALVGGDKGTQYRFAACFLPKPLASTSFAGAHQLHLEFLD